MLADLLPDQFLVLNRIRWHLRSDGPQLRAAQPADKALHGRRCCHTQAPALAARTCAS
jgi:hypothetical protein